MERNARGEAVDFMRGLTFLSYDPILPAGFDCDLRAESEGVPIGCGPLEVIQ